MKKKFILFSPWLLKSPVNLKPKSYRPAIPKPPKVKRQSLEAHNHDVVRALSGFSRFLSPDSGLLEGFGVCVF